MTSQLCSVRCPRASRLSLLRTLLLVGGVASCSPTILPGPTIWSANLSAVPPSSVEGTLGAVSQAGATKASMDLRLGESGVTYGWRMAEGDCSSEGTLVGGRAAYPDLVASATGSAEAEATLPGDLTSGGSYAARIVQVSTGGTEQVVACGVLQQTK
jgi:hypothetical protein